MTPSNSNSAGQSLVRRSGLFRWIDWVTFLATFAAVWIGYYLTLAPELTLEDSGELATGSFYAGIPHPPGYPVWTIYTWLWTMLVPFKNVAWRVALGEATGGALAAGLLGLLVSRGSSLLMEGIEDLKGMAGHWESAICVVSGFVAGMLIGYNGFMWSQSVIVEVYSFSVASLMVVLLCLLRWIYAPHQRRYLYLALFFHGLCFTNHQTLIVAAMGIEVAIAAANFRLGRAFFLGNSIVYVAGLILKQQHILTALEQNQAVFVIFNVVGLCSLAAYAWFAVLTRETVREYCLDGAMAGCLVLLSAAPAQPFCGLLALAALAAWIKFARDTWKEGWEWLVVILCGLCWLAGAAFYFYMPLAGMTNPPMQWGYPRTVEGFIHAFSRGQYEKTNPTDIIHDPLRFLTQLSMFGAGIIEEFNWLYAFLALAPFAFFFKLHKRERAWLVGLTAIYLCLGVLLLILLNPPPDRTAQELVRVFFTASHTLIALMVGYGLTLVAAYMATHYERFRRWGLMGGAVAVALALVSFLELTQKTYFGETAPFELGPILSLAGQAFIDGNQYGLPIFGGLILLGLAVLFVAAVWLYRRRAPLAVTLGVFALMPLHPILTHWSDNEQRDHWFGYWFGHDMFTPPFQGVDGKPLYPEMTKDAVLFGGTDPGRFCPTYMIFCDSFLPRDCQPALDREFDRRDVYIITQNALADGTYLCYIRAQYNRGTQIDPPFFQELFRSDKERQENLRTNFLAHAVQPVDRFFIGLGDRIEKRRRTCTSWFTEKDFADLPALATRLRPAPEQDLVSKYLFENLSPETQELVRNKGDLPRLRSRLAEDLNRLLERELAAGTHPAGKETGRAGMSQAAPLYEPARFKEIQLPEYLRDFIRENPQSHTRIRLNRLLLEAGYPQEIARSRGGVYPDREIYIPTPADSAQCYNEYLEDAQRRLKADQLMPGEGVKIDQASGRVQIGGQVSVMAINGLLTKVIFDHNPKNEFFVEESFPLQWMYPYLTPYGIIMKINRQPVGVLSGETLQRDHEFWTQYSRRFIGDWITYDTRLKEITDWVEKVYLRRNFKGFAGDRKFIRDDQAQKAFSKLRGSIGGLYAWRVAAAKPGSVEQQQVFKEAEFAFQQAFAFCPYSSEVLMRYVNLLLTQRRFEDALLLAQTCLKLDPYNGQVLGVVEKLKEWKKQQAQPASPQQELERVEKAAQDNPQDFQAAFNLASSYLQLGQTGRTIEVLDRLLNHPQAGAAVWRVLLQAYASVNSPDRIQATVDKLAAAFRASPSDLDAGIGLAEGYLDLQKKELAQQTLDQILHDPKLDANRALQVVQLYAALANYPGVEAGLEKLVKLSPESAEVWYDLAAVKASVGKGPEAIQALRQALDLSARRRQRDPSARDLLVELGKDRRFDSLRQDPEFRKLAQRD